MFIFRIGAALLLLGLLLVPVVLVGAVIWNINPWLFAVLIWPVIGYLVYRNDKKNENQ